MKKLLQRLLAFRENNLNSYQEKYSFLVEGQKPGVLMVSCCDSRFSPQEICGVGPGEIFSFRNIGNVIPAYEDSFFITHHVPSEYVAIEFAIHVLHIQDIIICGHSECSAVQATWELHNREPTQAANYVFFKNYLAHLRGAIKKKENQDIHLDREYSPINHLSLANVLHQVSNLMSIPLIRHQVESGNLRLHSWWYDIEKTEMFSYYLPSKRFCPINEEMVYYILEHIK